MSPNTTLFCISGERQKKKDMVLRMEFNEMYYKFKSMVTGICYTYTKNISDTEDLVQDIFMKLYTVKQDFQSVDHLKHWLIRVSINESKNYVKSAWKKRLVFSNDMIANTRAVDGEDLDNTQKVFNMVHKLPTKYKDVIILYYYEDLQIKEISQILRISENSIKKRLERARTVIQVGLEKYND